MNKAADFISDNNPTSIYYADISVGMPEYVKDADVITAEDVAGLAAVSFADKATRTLPIHTKAATWMSAAYYYGTRTTDKVVEHAIEKAASLHGIAADVENLKSAFISSEKQASASEERNALEVDFAGEFGLQKQAFYPINDYADVVSSAEQMCIDYRDGALPYEYLASAAKELVKAAAEYRVHANDLPAIIVKLGSPRIPTFEGVDAAMDTRRAHGMSTEGLTACKSAFDAAEAAVPNGDAAVMEELEKIAQLDRREGLDYTHVVDPFSAAFTGPTTSDIEKLAASNVFIADVMVPAVELCALSDADISRAFTENTEAVVKEAAASAGMFTAEGCAKSSCLIEGLGKEVAVDVLQLLLRK